MRLLVRRREAAELLGIPEGLLRQLVQDGEMPHLELHGKAWFSPQALAEWVQLRTSEFIEGKETTK